MKILSRLDNTGMIDEVADKRYVTDAEKSAWNSKPDTDTVTTINGKTGAITKEDIVALGIPSDSGSIVDLGTFNDPTELITHAVMNQLPTRQYTFFIDDTPFFMLLRRASSLYNGIFHNSGAVFFYFEVSFYGEILELKEIDLRALNDFVDLGNFDGFENLWEILDIIAGSVESMDTLKADKTYVDSKVQTDVPPGAKFTDTITSVNGQIGDIELTGDDLDYFDYVEAARRNVGSTLNEINDAIYMFGRFIIGTDYDLFNDPTLKEILEMFTIVLGDYELGVAPSLGEIVEEISNIDIPDSTWESIQNKPDTFVPSEHNHIIGNITGLQNELNSKETPSGSQSKADVAESNAKSYVDGKVKTDVPVGAKFTDTVYTHPTTHSISEVSGLQTALDGKVDNSQVLTNVPLNAKFTDTVYSHPNSHPASMITESSTKRFVSDSEKSVWNSKSDTDTVTTINGKTGAITKEDIVALGIPSDSGSIVDLGSFNDETELITYVVMNQLPTGHYTFILNDSPVFMLLELYSNSYFGTFYDTVATFYYFEVSIYGEIKELKTIDLRALSDFVDLGNFDGFENLWEILYNIAGSVESMDTLKADKTYVDGKVQTNVPAGAKFTDTVTTINGKTGAISKADIVALGIPSSDTNTTYTEITTAEIDTGASTTLRAITGRRVKYILDKVQGWIGGLTKSDVGLSNVDNIKQMPISGGSLENYREKLVTLSASSGSINLSLGNVFQHTPSGNRTYSITNAVSGVAHSFTLIINMGSTVRTLTFPASVKWRDDEIPDMSTPLKEYELFFTTTNGGSSWRAGLGGVY